MTRKSRREIERVLDDLDGGRSRNTDPHPPLDDRYGDDVVALVHSVCRDLLRIRYRNPERIANAHPTDAVTEFLERVREQYAIDEDRDRCVQEVLASSCDHRPYWDPIDSFAAAPAAIASRSEPVAGADELLTDLVADGREDRAERLLVHTVYNTLAEHSSGEVVVA